MMAKKRLAKSRALPLILVLIAIAITIAVLISLARAFFLPNSNDKEVNPESSLVLDPTKALLDTSADRSVSLVASGPIVAQENFRSYQILISPSSRKLILYEGYLDTVVDSIELSNNVQAYTQFVNALNRANLTAGNPLKEDDNLRLGVCATGEFYQFDVLKNYNNEVDARYWTSTCSGSPGTLKANARQIIDLFVVQIPGAKSTLKNINVYSSS